MPRRAHLDEQAVRFAEFALVSHLIAEEPRQRGALDVNQRRVGAGLRLLDHQHGPPQVGLDRGRSLCTVAITKFDIRGLINKGVISRRPIQGISKFHARKIKVQKKRGRRKGSGSRKGTFAARADEKFVWMNTVRAQRSFLKKLKSKKLVSTADCKTLYAKSKGGYFRSVQHMKLFINEQGLIKK